MSFFRVFTAIYTPQKIEHQLYQIEYNQNINTNIYWVCQTWWQSGCSLPCTRSELQRGEAKGIPSGIYVLIYVKEKTMHKMIFQGRCMTIIDMM